MKKYDYLLVGSGLFAGVFAYFAKKEGKSCLVLEKRDHIGGNIACEEVEGINVHKYGAHIFHTSNKQVWKFVNDLVEFNRYTNSPVANYKGEMYNMPFNMNTFSKMWKISTPEEAKQIIDEQRKIIKGEPKNLEEQAISLVGTHIYQKLVKGYTEKQWGRSCKDLPAFIIKRLPLRFTYDNNYFNDRYQGIPIGGYTAIVEKMLDGIEIRLNTEYRAFLQENAAKGEDADTFEKILYTGMIDEYFDYQLGELEYRSLRFEHELLEGEENHQGNAVVNYTERQIPYTRIIEHKHFEFGSQPDTVITREYPADWKKGDEPYYPINNERNDALFAEYQALAEKEQDVLFGGRLGQYRYYDMDKVIEAALSMVASQIKKKITSR